MEYEEKEIELAEIFMQFLPASREAALSASAVALYIRIFADCWKNKQDFSTANIKELAFAAGINKPKKVKSALRELVGGSFITVRMDANEAAEYKLNRIYG